MLHAHDQTYLSTTWSQQPDIPSQTQATGVRVATGSGEAGVEAGAQAGAGPGVEVETVAAAITGGVVKALPITERPIVLTKEGPIHLLLDIAIATRIETIALRLNSLPATRRTRLTANTTSPDRRRLRTTTTVVGPACSSNINTR